MSSSEARPGEVALPFDPGQEKDRPGVVFIGRIRSPWTQREGCPRNLRQARERGGGGTVEVDAPYRPGLADLSGFSHVILLYWMDKARRDLIVQRPRHSPAPRGVFSVRSPVRPNPIGLAVVKLLSCDAGNGRLEIDAIDCLDGTPLIDIKPYLPSIDAVPDALTPG